MKETTRETEGRNQTGTKSKEESEERKMKTSKQKRGLNSRTRKTGGRGDGGRK